MTHWPKAEKDSSSGPEIATCQSRCRQNSASMCFNSFTSNKPMLHQPFLGGEGYSQRNFAVMMTVTRNNCWPVQPSSSEMPQRQCRRSATVYGMLGRRENNVQMLNMYSMKSVVTGMGEE